MPTLLGFMRRVAAIETERLALAQPGARASLFHRCLSIKLAGSPSKMGANCYQTNSKPGP